MSDDKFESHKNFSNWRDHIRQLTAKEYKIDPEHIRWQCQWQIETKEFTSIDFIEYWFLQIPGKDTIYYIVEIFSHGSGFSLFKELPGTWDTYK